MPTTERRLWLALQRQVGLQTPAMNKAILDAFRALVASLSEAEMIRALANPDTFAERIATDVRIRNAMIGVRTELSRQVRDGFLWFTPELPNGAVVNGTVAIGFNVLDLRVIEAIRLLDTRVMQRLSENVRETMRVIVLDGLENQQTAAQIARRIRSTVGLAPNQARAVMSFREALETGKFGKALRFGLRDKRFDRTLARLKASRGTLDAEIIDRMVSGYERKFRAFNANTNARTAVLDAQRLGKHLATQEAIDAGILDGTKMVSKWVNAAGGVEAIEERINVRDLHRQAHGEVVRFGQPFSVTGEIIPGESTFNCRCVKRDFMVRDVQAALHTPPLPVVDSSLVGA